MKHPLIRQGGGPEDLDARYAELEREREQLRRMTATATADNDDQDRRRRKLQARSPAGDEQRLRAIPVSVEGVAGVIPNTQPEQATIRKLSRA